MYSRGLLVRNPLCKGRKGVLWLKLAGDTEGWHSPLLSPSWGMPRGVPSTS